MARKKRINSNRKGKKGELTASKKLAELFGCEARRGQQYSGNPEAPDVVHSIAGVHIEVKRVESFQLHKSMEQARGDAGENVPVVLTKQNRKPWMCVVALDDLPKLAEQIYLTMYET